MSKFSNLSNHSQSAGEIYKILYFGDRRTLRLFNDAPNPHIIKIFFYILIHQPDEGTRGFKINKQQLQFDLKLSRTNFFDSLRWLKDNLFIQELKMLEESDFMVNPYILMNNGDYDERIKEWARRQHLDSAREQRLRKERRLRAFRKAKKS